MNTALLLAAFFAAETITWGPAANGLKLGIGWAAKDGQKALAVSFENRTRREFVFSEVDFFIELEATGPNGEHCQVLSLDELKMPPSSPPSPLNVVRVAAGQTHRFLMAPDRFICVVKRKDVPLPDLLHRGYTVNALLDAGGYGKLRSGAVGAAGARARR